jgi:hypothetical protein
MTKPKYSSVLCLLVAAWLGVCRDSEAAKRKEPVTLTAEGEKLLASYSEMLASLRAEVVAALPAIDEKKKASFMKARATLDSLKAPGEKAAASERTKYNALKEQAEADALAAARAILTDVNGFLTDDKLDAQLMKVAILTHATPRGLAEFAQQGAKEKALLDKLFADEALMKQILRAGGANGGEYGESMQVYTAILEKSERARVVGSIFQHLALGTALQQPWMKDKEPGGVYGIVHADGRIPGCQVERYLQYEKAHLADELDPAFKDMNTWECRFITNDPYTDEELVWTRKMLRNYRPDHMTNPDYKWRYARMVKSDVPYASPDWRPDEGTSKVQQIVAGGGKCGPRAFFGRTVSRAFGIPSRRSTQRGHAAMNHWTPDGWVVNFGGWWSINWAGPWGGLDFLLESQAREFPDEFIKVIRAQWIGDVLDESDVSIRQYGKGGGLWKALAFHKKQVVVADAKAEALGEELAELSGEEARLLGESDEILGDKSQQAGVQIPEDDRAIVIHENGSITIPAAACLRPTDNTDKITFMQSSRGGWQVHYQRLGKRPELLKYTVEAPKAGKYSLTANVATVARKQSCILRLNRRTLIDINLPFSLGMWEDTEPVTIDLREGRNTLMFTCRAPNRGVSIKEFALTPVK